MSLLDLFRPKWKSSNGIVNCAAAKKITNQKTLVKIANKAKSYNVRTIAVEKLTDQDVLAKVARNDTHDWVRKAAVENLADHAILSEIAKKDENWEVRKAAYLKIGDEQAALAEVAKYDTTVFSRSKEAIEKLNFPNQVMLAEIAKNRRDQDVRLAAIEKLTDQAALAEIAKKDLQNLPAEYDCIRHEYYVDIRARVAAIDKLIDQTVLAEIAESDKDWKIRRTAYKKLGNNAMVEVEDLVQDLSAVDLSTRQSSAIKLIEIARKDPNCLLQKWNYLQNTISYQHRDGIESTGKPNDCTNAHKDEGIGLEFPPYPPK